LILFVYFIQRGSDGPVKIGKSQNPESRRLLLQQSSPEPLQIIGVCLGGYPAESQLHRWFAADRLEGEWFERSDALNALLDRLPSWDDVTGGSYCPELLNNERTILAELYRMGYTLEDIAGLLTVSRNRVHQIISGKNERRPRRKWTYDPVTKRNFITIDIHKDRCETRPEEPIESAYQRLTREHCGIDLVLPERDS
jgi:hypothetical protein